MSGPLARAWFEGVAVVALAGALAGALAACGPPVPEPSAPAVAPAAPVETVPPPAPAPLAPATPLGLTAPTIGLDTGPLRELGINATGALETPGDATAAGWFRFAPTPGAPGPAVVVGGVDAAGAPGVFRRLAELAPGDEVSVARADGALAVFETYRVERYPRSAFPTERVYGDTGGAELRLIGCGGAADGSPDNVVVYARLVRVA